MKKEYNSNIYEDARHEIAVLIPCLNEEVAITKTVLDMRRVLPTAKIYVYDNNSTDNSVSRARDAGAIVREELLPGKGNVVRRMFADIEADIYVLVDGDDTYNASDAPSMVHLMVSKQLDMVNGMRVTKEKGVHRKGHAFGNKMLTGIVGFFFGNTFKDILSGYRVFSRRFVKSFPALSSGFEIETELTVHALEMRMKVAEVETLLQGRSEGSSKSKLHTYKDGVRILRTILMLIKEERPLPFFTVFGTVLAILSIAISIPIILSFIETLKVTRVPTLFLSTGLMLLGFLSFVCGLILDTVTRGRREVKRLHYLSYKVLDS